MGLIDLLGLAALIIFAVVAIYGINLLIQGNWLGWPVMILAIVFVIAVDGFIKRLKGQRKR